MIKIKQLFESLLTESYRIDNNEYMRSHNKKPRGIGNWFIKVNGKSYNPRPNMGISQAIQAAIKMAHEAGNKQTVDVVEPQP
jgi:hypothetical protein